LTIATEPENWDSSWRTVSPHVTREQVEKTAESRDKRLDQRAGEA
jgi:hypothetical protein